MNAYQLYRQLLFAKADSRGVPLSGTFELTARCNLDCKMCYIHRRANDAAALRAERTAAEWLRLAEECCRAGTLLLLLTGGEPLLRPDFREIYTGCKKLGLMLSINTNATLLDERMADFLAADAPSRVNITLYGAFPDTYAALCGDPSAHARALRAIELLQSAGVPVKLNCSVTPYNRRDAGAIYAFAREHGLPIQTASYMFPPVRACEHGCFSAERLSSDEAAEEKLRSDLARFTPDELAERWGTLLRGEAVADPTGECQELPTERIRCRAGSSTFWVTWDGQLRPCGMLTSPTLPLTPGGFAEAWQRIRAARERILLPAQCTACSMKNACDQCAAVCQAETGEFTGVPEYMCRQTERYLQRVREEYDKLQQKN